MLKAIHAGEDLVAARQRAVQVIEKLRGLRLTKAAELGETAVKETLAYYAFVPCIQYILAIVGSSEVYLNR
jgi:putative transposase